MMTKDQYIESLRKMNLKVYLMGERIENPVDHPMIRPSMNSVAMTYELAEKEEYNSRARPSTVSATCTKAPTTLLKR